MGQGSEARGSRRVDDRKELSARKTARDPQQPVANVGFGLSEKARTALLLYHPREESYLGVFEVRPQ